MNQPDDRLSPGALNAAISNEVVRLVADFTGRGATKSRAFLYQDVVVCLLEDGATKAESNLVAAGQAGLVRQSRRDPASDGGATRGHRRAAHGTDRAQLPQWHEHPCRVFGGGVRAGA